MHLSTHFKSRLIGGVLVFCQAFIVPNSIFAQQKGSTASSYGFSKKNKLLGRAVLGANTFAAGPTSGFQIGNDTINGQPVPFINKQPVQGFSAILNNGDGTYYAMSDNGFGSMENSADYNLRIYKIKPEFKTSKRSQKGGMDVLGYIELNDKDNKIPFPIVNEFSHQRTLTGADFDIESIQRVKDGSFWIGDEFGPFLIHVDKSGKVLEPPYALPDFENAGLELRAPQNPYNEEGSAVRVMNAMKRHALNNGSEKTPVFSPWFVMLDDENEDTKVDSRENPSLGIPAASSEIFNVRSLQRAGFPVVVYTVNDTPNMEALVTLGVDGIISDRPDLLLEVLKAYDADNDGQADFLNEEGLVDINLFDVQGHRGARNLRPENTLPSMEAALDNLMTTLETDCGVTKDGKAVLDHDPFIEASKARKADGSAYEEEQEVLVKDLTLSEIQSTFIADKILPGRPAQVNDRTLSPVSVAFAMQQGLMDPYIMPSLKQLFDFVNFYVDYYQTGAGSSHPQAMLRWKNASMVRFNIETKLNPRTDLDHKGFVFNSRTRNPQDFVRSIAGTIKAYKLEDRADIQSFDFRSLLKVHQQFPNIRTVCLFGDFPKVGETGDGTNLQGQDGNNTPWLAGMAWPYRSTRLSNPANVPGSGGFEGMALSKNGKKLLPLLEKPLIDAEEGVLLIHEFDLQSKQYNGNVFKYQLNDRGTAIGDFIMFDHDKGLIIERDGSQGTLDGFKSVYEVEINKNNEYLGKRLAVDLLDILDNKQISNSGLAGDVGLGLRFAFPFVTIESVVFYDNHTIGILNDNNYPFSIGRHVGEGLPDDNEFIRIRLGQPLGSQSMDYSSFQEKHPENIWPSDNSLGYFKVYPNPFEDKVDILLQDMAAETVAYQVLDFSGAVIVKGEREIGVNHQLQIDLSETTIKKGFYLLRITPAGKEPKTHWIYKK